MEKQATNNTASTSSQRVHNLIILDESGSMMSIWKEAMTGVNETLGTIRAAKEKYPEQEHLVTLIAFDTPRYDKIFMSTPIDMTHDITEDEYLPRGMTPLYDAMGRALNELKHNVKEGDIVLVTVITDGYENASREYTGPAIKKLIEELKKQDWVFTYIGANQDVEKAAGEIAINNHMAFTADNAGTRVMFDREMNARNNFFKKVHHNSMDISHEDKMDIADGYFSESDDFSDSTNSKKKF